MTISHAHGASLGLAAIVIDATRLVLTTDVPRAGAGCFAGWPHAARAAVAVTSTSSGRLDIALSTTNTGTTPIALTQALHTYLAIGDIAGVSVAGLDGCAYVDKLAADVAGAQRRQSGGILIAQEVDRIYFGTRGPIDVVDPRLGRTIRVTRAGSDSAVVWNPWRDKAARLGDITDPAGGDAWRRLLCVEATNAGPDVVHLAPGATQTLSTTIGIAD